MSSNAIPRKKAVKLWILFKRKYGHYTDGVSNKDLAIYLLYLYDLGLLEFAMDGKKVIGLLELWRLRSFEGCEKEPPEFEVSNFSFEGNCLFLANLTIHPDYENNGMISAFKKVLKIKHHDWADFVGWKDIESRKLRIYGRKKWPQLFQQS